MGLTKIRSAERTDRQVGDELHRVGCQCAAVQQRLVHLAAEFADRDLWLLDGSPTPAHWIAEALDVEVCTAREWIRIGRSLRDLRGIDSAFAARELSYSKVRQLTRVATVDNEAEMLEIAGRTPAGRLGAAIARWMSDHESDEETERRHHRDRPLTYRTEVDGMVVGQFRLPPVAAAPFLAAIDTAVMTSRPTTRCGVGASADPSWSRTVTGRESTGWPSLAQQRADALVELIVTVSVLIHDAERRPINAPGRHRRRCGQAVRDVVSDRDDSRNAS